MPVCDHSVGRSNQRRLAEYYDGYTREHEFLLRLLGNEREASHIDALAEQIDWKRLMAITPGDLVPYVAFRLSAVRLESCCPQDTLERILRVRRAAAAQMLHLRRDFRRLLRAFCDTGVQFIALKGLPLAYLAYPDACLRTMNDVDLLVQPSDMKQALRLAAEAGFTCPERYRIAHPMTLADRARVAGGEISLPLERPGSQVLLELHTQIELAQPWFDLRLPEIWARTEGATFDGIEARVLEKHDFLLHLVLHLARNHVFDRGLRPLLDVHLWVLRYRHHLDWQWLARRCATYRYGPWVYLTLKIVRDTLGTPIPDHFFKHVAPPEQLEELQRLVYRQIWDRAHCFRGLCLTLSGKRPSSALVSLLKRVQPLQSAADSPRTIPPVNSGGLRVAGRRVTAELAPKVRSYLRAWRQGELTGAVVRREIELLRERSQLETLLKVAGDRATAGHCRRYAR